MATNVMDFIERKVDQLFAAQNANHGERCRNPVTDGEFVWGIDPITPQKQEAVRALHAGLWFEKNGPANAPRLPLSHAEREDLKRGGVSHILAWYARSLEALDYDVNSHPEFEDFACGVMARQETPDFILSDPLLRRRFPPRLLRGLGVGTMWSAPRAA